MGKRTILLIIFILGLAITIPGYFLFRQKSIIQADPYSAVPLSAGVVIETIDLRSFINTLSSESGFFGAISSIEELSSYSTGLKRVAECLNNPQLGDIFKSESNSVISFYSGDKGYINALLSMPVPEITYGQLKNTLESSGISIVEETGKRKEKVLKTLYSSKDTAFITLRSGLLLVSDHIDVLTLAIQSLEGNAEKPDIRSHGDFARILMAAGNQSDKLFVIFDNLGGFVKPLLSSSIHNPEKIIQSIASAGSGDIVIDNDGIILAGYSKTRDTTDYLDRFRNSDNGQLQTYRILPFATALFESVIVKEDTNFNSSGTGAALAGKLKKYLGPEITRAIIDVRENDLKNNTVFIYELKNREMAEQAFLEFTDQDRTTMWFEPQGFRVPVYKLSYSGFANSVIPSLHSNANDSLFTFYENYLITGSSYLTIARTVYDNINNNTLAGNIAYKDFESLFPSQAGYFFYFVPSRIINYLDGLLEEDLIRSLKKNKNFLNNIPAAGFQLSSSNGMIFNNVALSYKEGSEQKSKIEWQTNLDTTAITKPYFFTNHLTGAQEIFIQDANNNCYLVNASGRILWKIKLREKIEGSVFMIDYYKNGKLQLLFNGRNYLHLIDRNGRYVEKYPVKLKSPSTAGMSLFDYENNKNYRIFIPGEDKLIYAFDKTGSPVKGWKQFKTTGSVNCDVSHFRVSGKDYIVVADDKSIYLLDRSGNPRLFLKEPVEKAPGSSLRLVNGSETFLTCTSNDGTVQKIFFDGSVIKSNFRKFTPDHLFDLADLNGDGRNEYIYVDEGTVFLYDNAGIELFSNDVGTGNLKGLSIYSFSADDKKIGILDDNDQLVYLLDNDGDVMEGFPVNGATLFSIGRIVDKTSWHMIIGDKGRILYNYKLETDI